jgi:hypothetical protein
MAIMARTPTISMMEKALRRDEGWKGRDEG